MDPPILGRHKKSGRSQNHKKPGKKLNPQGSGRAQVWRGVSTLPCWSERKRCLRSLGNQGSGRCPGLGLALGSPLNSGCWRKDSMPWGTGEVPDTEDRTIMLASGLV